MYPLLEHLDTSGIHLYTAKTEFMATFSTKEWGSMNASEKAEHTLQSCKACHKKYISLSQSFPPKTPMPPSEIKFSEGQLSTPTQFCSKLLKDADSICRTNFHTSIEQAIEATPQSRLIVKRDSKMRLAGKRKILREIKQSMESDMNAAGDVLVLQNRVSWNRFDKIWKA